MYAAAPWWVKSFLTNGYEELYEWQQQTRAKSKLCLLIGSSQAAFIQPSHSVQTVISLTLACRQLGSLSDASRKLIKNI